MSLEDWASQEPADLAADTSLGAMDDLVRLYASLREDHDEAKKAASEIYEKLEDTQNKIIAVLTAARKKSYKVDGVGTFSVVDKQTVKIPDTLDKKRMLLGYIKQAYGDDVFDSMVAIHHQTLNSFYNQEVEKHKDDPMFHLPGIEAPMVRKEARFSRDR